MPTETTAPYFDFHFHLLFKNYLQQFEEEYPSVRKVDELLPPFQIEHALWDKVDDWFLHFLDSQSCYQQIERGRVGIGAVAIAPAERMFASREGLGGKLLNDRVVTRPVDPQYMETIRKGEISYYHLFLKEFQLYLSLHRQGKLELLSRAGKKGKAASNGANGSFKPRFVLGMEGGHTLSRTKIGRPGVPDIPHDGLGVEADALYRDFIEHINQPLYPAESLQHLQQALWEEGLDLCYLILTHLSHIPHQHLATHAYGMKFLQHEAKYPVGFGLSELGKEVVHAAYTLKVKHKQKKVAAPVLIDIKHLSLKSRLDLYQLRAENPDYAKVPLVASHMGVTGYSISAWKDSLLQAERGKASMPTIKIKTERKVAGQWGRINKTFTYNPWTINLMDDDIIRVLESNGLIGVSLDIRILGVESQLRKLTKNLGGNKAAYEYLSPEEFRYFFPRVSVRGLAREAFYDDEGEKLESYTLPNKTERHPLALCLNIVHIVAVGQAYTQTDPWKHICIGSDFDGLIDPVKNCRDAGQFPQLEKEILRWLPVAARAYEEEHGLDGILNGSQPATLVQQLMSKNGQEFISRIGF